MSSYHAWLEGSNLASVKPLILDALSQSSSFTKLLYSYAKRNGNKLSNSVAQHLINIDDYVMWMENVSLPLLSIVQADISKLSFD